MGSTPSNLSDEYLTIVPRKEWKARKPFLIDPMSIPVGLVCFHATHSIRFPWSDKVKAYRILRDLQQFHMYQKIMPDIQYNFLIDEVGTIYEGRGWYTKPSMNPGMKKMPNLTAIYIGYIGNSIAAHGPTDQMMKAGNDLISFGMRHEMIRYHHHISGMIAGIVGTTLEVCKQRRKMEKDESAENEKPNPDIPGPMMWGPY